MNKPSFKTVSERLSEECGCPEHDIEMNHVTATVHIEPDGTGDAFVHFGDWEEEWHFTAVKNIDDLKSQTFEKFCSIPHEH